MILTSVVGKKKLLCYSILGIVLHVFSLLGQQVA